MNSKTVLQQTWNNFDDIDYFKVSWLPDSAVENGHGKILGIEAHWMNGFFMTCGKSPEKIPELGILAATIEIGDPLDGKHGRLNFFRGKAESIDQDNAGIKSLQFIHDF